jgi:hypothetical protein
MSIKSAKPQTNVKIDLLLFTLILVIIISGIKMRTLSLDSHALLMFQRAHGWIGVIFCFLISLHLLAHLPWIQSQLARIFKTSSIQRKVSDTLPPSD